MSCKETDVQQVITYAKDFYMSERIKMSLTLRQDASTINKKELVVSYLHCCVQLYLCK